MPDQSIPDEYRKSWERLVLSQDVLILRFARIAVIGWVLFALVDVLGMVVWLRAMTGDLGCIG